VVVAEVVVAQQTEAIMVLVGLVVGQQVQTVARTLLHQVQPILAVVVAVVVTLLLVLLLAVQVVQVLLFSVISQQPHKVFLLRLQAVVRLLRVIIRCGRLRRLAR
jgi:hypothetical protein